LKLLIFLDIVLEERMYEGMFNEIRKQVWLEKKEESGKRKKVCSYLRKKRREEDGGEAWGGALKR
jgi:hypothetical protein